MNVRKIKIFCALSLTALLFTGCAGMNNQAGPISSEAAKNLALADAGIPESAVERTSSTLGKRNQLDYYAVTFTANGTKYEYDIDATTGTVIESRTSPQAGSGAAETPAAAGNSETAAGDGATGTIADDGTSQIPASSGSSGNGALITETEAREKALSNAGFTADQVTFFKSKLVWNNGRQIYIFVFYNNHQKYYYAIDAGTGEIMRNNYEIKDNPPAKADSGAANITAQQAKEIALKQVPGAKESDIWKFKTDHDHGRLEYEGKIVYNEMMYEFEIDGYSGAIQSWEAKSVYH